MKTLPQLAEDALAVQDAYNLTGVARGFIKAIDDIRAITPDNTEWKRHPILKLWVDKLASMVGTQGDWDSMTAYNHVNNIVDSNLLSQLEAAGA